MPELDMAKAPRPGMSEPKHSDVKFRVGLDHISRPKLPLIGVDVGNALARVKDTVIVNIQNMKHCEKHSVRAD